MKNDKNNPDIMRMRSVGQFSTMHNNKNQHPLVSIVDMHKADKTTGITVHTELYSIVYKDMKCGDIRYGASRYDYDDGTLLFFAPGQVIQFGQEELHQPSGKVLIFHPDFMFGTSLRRNIEQYNFFQYSVHEALHLSQNEQAIIMDCYAKIENELTQPIIDKHTKQLICSYIELILTYCVRFYERQFIVREVANKGILKQFEVLLKGYFTSKMPQLDGVPLVSYFADQLHLSPGYFGDLVKKETGKSAQQYIQDEMLNIAKSRIIDKSLTISEIAYDLGFKNPQSLTRLFKQRIGCSPIAFRSLN